MPRSNKQSTLVRYEEFLTDPIIRYLKDVCLRYSWQVPALNGRIDFIGIRDSYEIISIEAKFSDWRRALIQAHGYSLCTDKAYIAIPESMAKRALKNSDLFQKRGVGIMAVGEDLRIILKARKSQLTIPLLRKYVLKITRKRKQKSVDAVCQRVEKLSEFLKMQSDTRKIQHSLLDQSSFKYLENIFLTEIQGLYHQAGVPFVNQINESNTIGDNRYE